MNKTIQLDMFCVKQILKGSDNLETVTLSALSEIIMSDEVVATDQYAGKPINIIFSKKTIDTFRLLNHLWLADKGHIEICSYDTQNEFWTAKTLTPITIDINACFEYIRRNFKITIITLSDKANRGECEDAAGKIIKQKTTSFFEKFNYLATIKTFLIGNNPKDLSVKVNTAIKENTDLILTIGGTGIGPHDITVPIVQEIIDFELNGVIDLIRMKYGKNNPYILLSRAICGVKNKTVILSLPGNTKYIDMYFAEIEKNLLHAVFMLNGADIY